MFLTSYTVSHLSRTLSFLQSTLPLPLYYILSDILFNHYNLEKTLGLLLCGIVFLGDSYGICKKMRNFALILSAGFAAVLMSGPGVGIQDGPYMADIIQSSLLQ